MPIIEKPASDLSDDAAKLIADYLASHNLQLAEISLLERQQLAIALNAMGHDYSKSLKAVNNYMRQQEG